MARKVDMKTYHKVRQELLQLPENATIERDGFIFKLGSSGNTKNRMYYRDTQSVNKFNSQAFYDWAVEMSKKNTVLISSYHISDERFECVFEFTNARSTYQGGLSRDTTKTEKLFMVKGC